MGDGYPAGYRRLKSSRIMWLLIVRLGPIVEFVAQRQSEVWRGGRVVDGSGLENQHVRKGIVGSNPTPSVQQPLP